MPKTDTEVLDEAKRLIQRGWCKGDYFLTDEGERVYASHREEEDESQFAECCLLRLRDAIHAADRELITIADFSIQEAADAIDSVRAGLKDALAETDVPTPDDANVRPAQPYGWEGAEVVLVPGPKLGPPITVLTCSALCGWICATDDDGPFLCGACDRNGTMVPIGEVTAELEDLLRELTEAAALVPVQQSNRTETGQARVERFTEALVQARAFLRRARGEGAKP